MHLTSYPSTKKKKGKHTTCLCSAPSDAASVICHDLEPPALRVNTVWKMEGLLPRDRTLDAMCQSALERRVCPARWQTSPLWGVCTSAAIKAQRPDVSRRRPGPRKTCVCSVCSLFTVPCAVCTEGGGHAREFTVYFIAKQRSREGQIDNSWQTGFFVIKQHRFHVCVCWVFDAQHPTRLTPSLLLIALLASPSLQLSAVCLVPWCRCLKFHMKKHDL